MQHTICSKLGLQGSLKYWSLWLQLLGPRVFYAGSVYLISCFILIYGCRKIRLVPSNWFTFWPTPGLAEEPWLAPTTSSALATPSASTGPATARNPTSAPTAKVRTTNFYNIKYYCVTNISSNRTCDRLGQERPCHLPCHQWIQFFNHLKFAS